MENRLTRSLGVDHPVLLAPMDGIADAKLVNAVAAAGGFGLLGAGYGDIDWLERELPLIETTNFGCGFITWSLAGRPHVLDLALAHSPRVIFLSFGDVTPYIQRIHSAGAEIISQVHTLDQARRALDLGVNGLCVQGREAGGHGMNQRSTFTLVPEVSELIHRTGSEAFLIAAGGVSDQRHLSAARALGADGVLVGTRFCASREANLPREEKRQLIAADGDQTQRTSVYDLLFGKNWPDGFNERVLIDAFTSEWDGRESELVGELPQIREQEYDASQNHTPGTQGVCAGEGVGLIRSIESAADIVLQMVGNNLRDLDCEYE